MLSKTGGNVNKSGSVSLEITFEITFIQLPIAFIFSKAKFGTSIHAEKRIPFV